MTSRFPVTLSLCRLAILVAASTAACTSAHAAVVRHYSFDANFNDSSGNNQHGVAFDGNTDTDTDGVSITNTSGEFKFGGGGASFTDERDFVAVPSHTFGTGNAYSFSFWAKRGETGSQNGMVLGQRGNTNFFVWLNDNFSGLRFRGANSTDAARNQDFTAPQDTDFHHYVLTSDGGSSNNGTLKLYIDNGPPIIATNKTTGFIFDTIGEAYNTSLDFDFQGQIDEVWVFDEEVDAATVANLFNNNLQGTPEPSTLILAGLGLMFGLSRRRRQRLA